MRPNHLTLLPSDIPPTFAAMPFDSDLLLLAAIVALAFTVETVAGFGAMIIAMTLGLQLYPMKSLLGVLVPLNLSLQAYIVTRHHEHIARRLVVRRILPFMGLGLVGGLVFFERLPGRAWEAIFGVFVVGVAVVELVRRVRQGHQRGHVLSSMGQRFSLVGAGLCHGLFAAGGPLLVYALGRSALAKPRFRSTLATVWLALNLLLTVAYAATGRVSVGVVPILMVLLPAVVVGIAAGEWAHHRLDEARFRVVVFVLLAGAGAAIVLRVLIGYAS